MKSMSSSHLLMELREAFVDGLFYGGSYGAKC